jgi:hypothetical protein
LFPIMPKKTVYMNMFSMKALVVYCHDSKVIMAESVKSYVRVLDSQFSSKQGPMQPLAIGYQDLHLGSMMGTEALVASRFLYSSSFTFCFNSLL